jgi:hypothetical protein
MTARTTMRTFGKSLSLLLLLSIPSFSQDQLSTWAHKKKIIINTSPTGYNVASTLTNFPYLVRLSGKSFNFSEADPQGNDIRFASSNEDPFIHEIVQWDTAQKKAVMWVKVMTVIGQSADQFIYMYWGKPGAVNRSNGAMVFDTVYGYADVWHLSSDLKDATYRANNCTAVGTTTDSSAIFAKGRHFNGTSDYLTFAPAWPSCPTAGTTFSAWIRPDSIITGQVIYHGDNAETNFKLNNDIELYHKFLNGSWFGALGSGPGLGAQKWCLVTGVWTKGKSLAVFVNGDKAGSRDSIPDTLLNDPGTNYKPSIAAYNCASAFFKGSVCEARIMKIPVSDDWIKLSYMNQKVNPEDVPTIRYPKHTVFVKIGAAMDSIKPTISDMVDIITIDPLLPDYLYIDPKTGTIGGFGNDTCTNKVFIITATNMYGSTMDTVTITVGNNSVGALSAVQSGKARLEILGVSRMPQPQIIFSVPKRADIRSLGFRLYDCMGKLVWSSLLDGSLVHAGIQTMTLSAGSPSRGVTAGVYFLKMVSTDMSGRSRISSTMKFAFAK